MNRTTFVLVSLPVASFVIAFVLTWWCLFHSREAQNQQEEGKVYDHGIALTASKEESEAASHFAECDQIKAAECDFDVEAPESSGKINKEYSQAKLLAETLKELNQKLIFSNYASDVEESEYGDVSVAGSDDLEGFEIENITIEKKSSKPRTSARFAPRSVKEPAFKSPED
jgi:hypothetical protein